MILPSGATSPDRGYQFPNFYGFGYVPYWRSIPRQPAASLTPPVITEMRDTVTLSLAAQRIVDQAERLKQMNIGKG